MLAGWIAVVEEWKQHNKYKTWISFLSPTTTTTTKSTNTCIGEEIDDSCSWSTQHNCEGKMPLISSKLYFYEEKGLNSLACRRLRFIKVPPAYKLLFFTFSYEKWWTKLSQICFVTDSKEWAKKNKKESPYGNQATRSTTVRRFLFGFKTKESERRKKYWNPKNWFSFIKFHVFNVLCLFALSFIAEEWIIITQLLCFCCGCFHVYVQIQNRHRERKDGGEDVETPLRSFLPFESL